jgi:hypothetical protein
VRVNGSTLLLPSPFPLGQVPESLVERMRGHELRVLSLDLFQIRRKERGCYDRRRSGGRS